MSAWTIAILGARGLVGRAVVELLQERNFPVAQLFLLAQDDDSEDTIRFNGKNIHIDSPETFDWSQANLAFFVAGADAAEEYAERAAESGCVVIDTSGFFAGEADIPLIVPHVNSSLLADYRNRNIIALANGIVSQLLRTTLVLTDEQDISQIQFTSFVPASFYGKRGIDELAGQSARLLNGMAIDNAVFNSQLAFNLLPMAGQHQINNRLIDEAILIEQCRRVLGRYDLPITLDLINVPVFYGLAQTVNLTTAYPKMIEDIAQTLSSNADVMLFEAGGFPTPVSELESDLNLKIANLRYSYGSPEQLQCWTVTDNIRYLGALMSVETAEMLINDHL